MPEYTPEEEDKKRKDRAFDQYGREKIRYDETKESGVFGSSLNSLRSNFWFNIDKFGLSRLLLEMNAKGKPEFVNNPLSKDEKASRAKSNADAKELGKYMNLAKMKAKMKVEKKKPKPEAAKPSKPKYKDTPIPDKSDFGKKYYGKA